MISGSAAAMPSAVGSTTVIAAPASRSRAASGDGLTRHASPSPAYSYNLSGLWYMVRLDDGRCSATPTDHEDISS
jgi:hypothetical protein